MQTLGLSDSTPRSESRFKSLFWPTIRNDVDLDTVTTQGFWICFLVAVITLVWCILTRQVLVGVFDAVFFFLGGVGVRQRSRVAAVCVFGAYLVGGLVWGFNVVRIIFLALLLANVRGIWLSYRWERSASEPPPPRLTQTLPDRLSDELPVFLWPKVRVLFYVLAALELGGALLLLLARAR
ncbi:MAG: hypothetical protein ABSH46_12320 [Bryobacteraceae bacterium]|jgi:hypothetical protein